MAESIRDIIAAKFKSFSVQPRLEDEANSLSTHAHGNIIGSWRTNLADGKVTREQFEEAVDAFNEFVPNGKVEIYEDEGVIKTRLVDND